MSWSCVRHIFSFLSVPLSITPGEGPSSVEGSKVPGKGHCPRIFSPNRGVSRPSPSPPGSCPGLSICSEVLGLLPWVGTFYFKQRK